MNAPKTQQHAPTPEPSNSSVQSETQIKHLNLSYDEKEERLNTLSHGLGTVLAIIAAALLLIKGYGLSFWPYLGVLVYALSLVLLFASSTLYHHSREPLMRQWFKKLDHTAIYYLIAGTYTPFLSLAIPTPQSKVLLIALWIIAAIGTVFKLILIHRFQKVSLAAYLIMGWLAVLLVGDMQRYLSVDCLKLLIAGGLAYSIGALFYAMKSVRYTHVIWHFFVLIGAGLHFFAIYLYIL